MKRSLVGTAALALVLAAACGTIIEPTTEVGDANFEITVNPADIEHVQGSNTVSVRATVKNVSTRDFYANVGDGFNSAPEQDPIFAALGTHAVIERLHGADTWASAAAGVLVEGSRFVVLRAGKSYTLHSSVDALPGTYRIRFSYSDRNNDESASLPFQDYSATFTVQ